MTYAQAVEYLDSLAQFGWKLDLARIARLCELAGHPERQFPSVLVAGSAGKGSTCAILTSIFRAAGLRAGASPKPHLHTHRERVQVDGELISQAQFAGHMERIQLLAEQVTHEDGSPTVFEVLTLLAFLHFAESRVERAVVEVGLGGRFDATNVLTPDLSVITMIGLDHTDRLGDTVEKIAFEKAGIVKHGRPVVTGAEGGARRVIEEVAQAREAPLRALGREIVLENVRVRRDGTTFDLHTPEGNLRGLRLALAGEHQARNAAIAVATARWLREQHPTVTEEATRDGLERAAIPGRLQVVRERPLVIVDGAHSPDRADVLAQALRSLYLEGQPRRMVLVVGCSTGHEPEAVVGRLAPLATEVIATRSAHPAAVPAAEVAASARAAGVPAREVEPVAAAVREALASAGEEDLVVVTGSLFAVGEALTALGAVS